MVAQVAQAVMGTSAINKAADAQAKAYGEAADTTWRIYNQNREDTMPWLTTGKQALGTQADLLGISGNTGAQGYGSMAKTFGMEDFQQDPGYNFRLAEGEKALNRSFASKLGVQSGAASKALNRFNQDYASNEFGKAYDRYNTNQTNQWNRLGTLSGSGQTAANTLGNQGAQAATQANSYLLDSAQNRADASAAKYNQWSSGINQAMAMFTGGF